jgi:RNA-directed DNA polymerase
MSLFEQLCSWDNLHRAYRAAAKGKRGQAAVATFEYHLEDNLIELRDHLSSGQYRPGPYRSFYIHEPKKRLISAAPFRDRVVHHALCQLIEPVFERSFLPSSYANRIGKGTHRALNQAQAYSRNYLYVLQCDVAQFFPSIDHTLLHAELARKLTDERVLGLCDQILASGQGVLAEEYRMVFFSADDLFAALRPRGLPIGNLTSQFWANVYLNPFDHFVLRELRCRAYCRYVDDFLLFSNSKAELWGWKSAIEERMARMRLTIHPGTHPHPVSEGIPFLGFVVYPNRRRLKRRKVVHFKRKLKGMLRAFYQGKLVFAQVTESVRGWANHARFANTVGLRKSVLGGLIEPQK